MFLKAQENNFLKIKEVLKERNWNLRHKIKNLLSNFYFLICRNN